MYGINPLIPFFVFLVGTIIGSFCNVCIYRLPKKRSIVLPRSFCPHCESPIRSLDNIPIISFILLRGRCRNCRKRIPYKYPMVELFTGISFLSLYLTFGLSFIFAAYAILLSSLIIVTVIDLEYKIIPDVITLPGIIIGLILSLFILPIPFINSLIGIMIGGGFFYLIAIVSKGGMGGGDIKLIAMIGAFLGWEGTLVTILMGSLIGSIIGIALIITKKKKRRDPIPFGPFLALGAVISIFWGKDLLYWYMMIGHGR